MSILGRAKSKLSREIAAWGNSGGTTRRALYYQFVSRSFKREQDAVGAGITAYRQQMGSGKELYLLRRNIHRLEKALTMRPRRDKFAMNYIEQTVDTFSSVMRLQGRTEWLQTDEFKWVNSVLREYFDATRSSETPLLQVLERRYKDASAGCQENGCSFGPLTPDLGPSPLNIEALLELSERRRSVRWFQDRSVARAFVDNAIRVAQQAPTACNRQPYTFHVFDSKESIAKVAGIPMGAAGFAHQIPGLIVVVGDLSAFFDARDRHLIYVDGCLASMGLILGLESQGIASCAINWPDLPDREMAMSELLGLEDYHRVIMLIAYGYADPDGLATYSAKADLDSIRAYRRLA